MSTDIRPEISPNNKYWIEKHRYYELKHFCLQYPLWKHAYNSVDGLSKIPIYAASLSKSYNHSDPVSKCAEIRIFYANKMDMLERVAAETDSQIGKYILKGVTEGVSYSHLKTRLDIPCSRDVYYDLYRRFFWLLSRERE